MGGHRPTGGDRGPPGRRAIRTRSDGRSPPSALGRVPHARPGRPRSRTRAGRRRRRPSPTGAGRELPARDPARSSSRTLLREDAPVSAFRIVVLASGSGTNLQAILDSLHGAARSRWSVSARTSRRRGRWSGHGRRGSRPRSSPLPSTGTGRRATRRSATGSRGSRADLVVLAGYMQLLSAAFVQRFRNRVINIHPALLPAFPGLDAIGQALEAGVETTGVTVHFVDEGVDTGPAILQREVPVPPGRDRASSRRRSTRSSTSSTRRRSACSPGGGLGSTRATRGSSSSMSEPAADTSSEAVSDGAIRVRRALISVSDKTGVADFAKSLAGLGVEILSTGGTAVGAARGRDRGDRRRRVHRPGGDPRRPGEDAASAPPRGAAGAARRPRAHGDPGA